jgi:hypothetical protein
LGPLPTSIGLTSQNDVEKVEAAGVEGHDVDAPRCSDKEIREVPAPAGAPSVAEHRGKTADRSEAATAAADPVVAELEAALAMWLAGAAPKALRRVLRRIEELLDE